MALAAAFSASEFKAKCLSILDRLANRELDRVVITKRGRTVGILMPPQVEPANVDALFGCMRGSVVIADDLDLTAPIFDEPLDAEQGTPYQ